MRESDNFAYGPARAGSRAAPVFEHLRSWVTLTVLGWRAVGAASLLLITAMAISSISWTAWAFVMIRRGTGELRSRWAARYRARHVATGWLPLPSAPGRHRPTPAPGRHRLTGWALSFGSPGAHRPPAALRPAVSDALRRAADWRPQPIRSARRATRSRRLTVVLATMVSIFILSGLLPVSAATGDITTVAGRPDSGDGGAATGALIHLPQDVAVGPGGSVYVADTYNHRIRRISTAGTITTVAGTGTSGFSGDGGPAGAAQLRFPEGVWADTAGNVYIADSGNNRVRMVTTAGTIITVAGTGTRGFSGDGGPASAARLNDPTDITTDSAGNLYIADKENHRVRRVTPGGTITTYAGNGIQGYAGDWGPATSARLDDPSGVAINGFSGELYIADTDNHRIRSVASGGTITTVAGTGQQGDSNHPTHADKSQINAPRSVAWRSTGFYIADTGNDKIKFVNNTGSMSTVAGSGVPGFSGDGGAPTNARLDMPIGVATASSGAWYVADSENQRIRRISSGIITTFAGKNHYGGDAGPATSASLNRALGVGADASGNLYVADTGNHRVRRVAGGTISTIGGTGTAGSSGDGGAATSAQLNAPNDVAVDTSGNVYIADTGNHRIRRIDAAGTITTFAGTGMQGFSGNGGAATSAQLNAPRGVDVDAAGNVYIADTGNHRIRRVSTTGIITTVAGNGTGAFCGDGGSATSACIELPMDVALSSAGNLYIADFGNNRIRSVISGTIRTLAGNGSSSFSGDGGQATLAGLNWPMGVDVDGGGTVLISDSLNNRIRQVSPNGIIRTVGGNGQFGFSGDGGPAALGEMAFPAHITLDPAGNLMVADYFNNRVRMVESLALPGPTMTGTSPASPANENNPLIRGTATAGTTVTVYTTATCTGAVAATGGASTFADPGLPVTVPDNSTTSFYATATDANGGVSACSPSPVVYVEDSLPPGAPSITLEPASPGSDLTPSWSFTSDAGASTECELSSGGVALFDYAPCSSPHTYDLTGQPDGTYVFSVRATDAAGNQGVAATDSYALDSAQPEAPVITLSPDTPSDDTMPTWEFSLEPGSSAECELSNGGGVIDPFSPCNSPHTVNLNGDPDGQYTLRIQARDGAGNPSAPVSSAYTLDTTDPVAPTIGSGPSSPGSSTSPSWSFTVESGSTAECELRRGATVVSSWQACSSPDEHDLSGEPDGDYTFSVRAVDAAGNTGSTETGSYTLDTTGPQVNITSSPATPDSDLNPSWSFTTEPGAQAECELRRDASVISPWAPCAGSQGYDLNGHPDGAYTFVVHATDAAGNTGDPSTSVYVLDTTPPAVAITSGPAAFSSEQHPEWSFTSEAGVTTECELSSAGGGILQSFVPCTSPWSYDLSGSPDDSYTFTVHATDSAGNPGPDSTSSYTLDTSGPISGITSSPPSPGNSLTPSWGFTAESGATTECTLTSSAGVLSPWTPCASPQSYNLTGLPEGGYTFSVRAMDAASNVGAPASNTYILDRTAPSVSITSAPASPGNGTDPSWSFSTEMGAATECELTRGSAVIAPWGSCASPVTVSLAGQPDGTYTLRVRATDPAGNVGPAASSTYALDTTGPAVNLVSPASPSSDRSPTWTFTTEGGASRECELSRGTLVLQPFASCSSPATYDLDIQPDGTYTLRVRATDGAGNTGPVATGTYELDTAGPTVAIVDTPSSPGSSTSVSWSFTSEPGATTRCELSRGGVVLQPNAPCNGSKGYDISGGADGEYVFRVRATDAAGNTGAEATSSYTLDRTPPAIPTITGSPVSPDSNTSVRWSFTAEAGSVTECELTLAGAVVMPFGPCENAVDMDLTGKPDGDYTFSVRAVDALGNTSQAATSGYSFDTTGPDVSITSEPRSPGKGRNPTWEFETESGAAVECRLSRGGSEIYSDGSCVSPASFDLGGEADGTYTLRVTATDGPGNQGPTATSRYVLDTVSAPEDPVVEPQPAPAPARPRPQSQPVAEEPADEAEVVRVRDAGREASQPDRAQEQAEDPLPDPQEAREISTRSPAVRGTLGEFLENVGTVAAGLLEQPAFPLGLIGLVLGFLVVQNRVDRRDPKLAMAPVYPDPHLYFRSLEGPGNPLKPSNGDLKGPMT